MREAVLAVPQNAFIATKGDKTIVSIPYIYVRFLLHLKKTPAQEISFFIFQGYV